MNAVTILTVGRIKTPGLENAHDYFQKLASRYTKIESVELRASPLRSESDADRLKTRTQDGDLFFDWLERAEVPRAGRILLDPEGQSLSTDRFKNLMTPDVRRLVFVIGGAAGLPDRSHALHKTAGKVIAFGPQTLSHDLARVVLMEQIFRSLSSLAGHPYHK